MISSWKMILKITWIYTNKNFKGWSQLLLVESEDLSDFLMWFTQFSIVFWQNLNFFHNSLVPLWFWFERFPVSFSALSSKLNLSWGCQYFLNYVHTRLNFVSHEVAHTKVEIFWAGLLTVQCIFKGHIVPTRAVRYPPF